jgi:dihydrodipicolinate synthase/N-acetylneuraminate lyase
MSYKAFRGSGVALVTPFTAKGEVDFKCIRQTNRLLY